MMMPSLERERDPERALAVIRNELAGIDGHPEARFLRPADLRLVALDVLEKWIDERDKYPRGLRDFVSDYVIQVEQDAKPTRLAVAWRKHVRSLR